MEAFYIVLGALIAGIVSLTKDFVVDRWKLKRSELSRRRDLVELRLPDVLRFQAAIHWLDHDLDQQLGNVTHDNPYPKPGEEKIPGSWYQSMLELAHHPTLTWEIRSAAKSIVDEIERWHAIVEDLDTAKDVTERVIRATKGLLEELERAATES